MMVCSMVSLPRPNDVLSEKYRVEKIIGRGGMGVVMAAWHLELDQRIALKFLLPELAEHEEAAERFRREARASAKIKSEHVARVLDVGNLDGGVPYMVMEFLDGRDLATEHRERGPLPIQDCVDYVLQAIEAVAEAHALGIVHRDLKPENLFLSRRPDGTRCIKVLDFGISKSTFMTSQGRALTQTAIIMGSPFYMSPEQMRAPRSVDARTDIWSIGAILYDLMAGRPPYVADTIPQLCTMMLEGDPQPLHELRTELNPELERVITRCLARDIDKRWTSVGELAVALLPFASRSSRVHVERAGRVLRASETPPSPLHLPPESVPESTENGSAQAVGASWTRKGHGSGGAHLTQKAWESDRGRGITPAPKAEQKRPVRWLPLALLAGVVLVGMGAWMVSWASSSGGAAPVSSANVLVSPVNGVRGAGEPIAPQNAMPPAAMATVTEIAATAAAAAISASASAAPVSASPPRPVVPTINKPADKPAVPTMPPRPAASAPAGNGLTDFGGRQ